ncbi:hypothetical protein [Rhodococcoides fascians]|uniref:hypothetical protein n=1 Tax=Rhodococcoides fascians TaxID=1828 RepID=UPI00068A0F48|nr:hypothetical protein [Rhodococcus fascians]
MSDELITGLDVNAELCTAAGVDHDYRPHEVQHPANPNLDRTYWRCVWCHAVSCGDYGETDPCIEHYHHHPKPHRTAAGVTWPIGGDRP